MITNKYFWSLLFGILVTGLGSFIAIHWNLHGQDRTFLFVIQIVTVFVVGFNMEEIIDDLKNIGE